MRDGGRDLGLDAARGVALLSMFVAHFAPTTGPANVFTLSEHLTAFMFVLLIGCGAELGRRSPTRWRSSQVRAAALVVIGLLLMQLPMQIVVVLVWLGVMTVLATWISQLPSWAVLAVGVAAALVEPSLVDWSRESLLTGANDPVTNGALQLAFAGTSYRLAGFVLPACAGILLVRHAPTERARLVAGGAGLLVAAPLYLAHQTGTAQLVPYSGSHQELVFNTAIALATTALVWVVAGQTRPLGVVLGAAGALSLTIYTAQIVGDWAYFKSGGVSDDRWIVLAVACLAALAAGLLWRPIAQSTGWRGPLEGLVDVLARGRPSHHRPARAGRAQGPVSRRR